MNSIDTNILLYAINTDCTEHAACRRVVGQALTYPDSWIIADQVWFELYRLLRNPSVLQTPLSAKQAAECIAWYRESSGWLTCAWEPAFMKELHLLWNRNEFPARNSFDLILALTLKKHGVKTFYTRNTKDFAGLNYFRLHNPLDA